MSYFEMYLLTKLDSLGSLAFATSIISLVCSGFIFLGCVFGSLDYDNVFSKEDFNRHSKTFKLKTWFLTGCISLFIAHAIPTTKQAAFIYIAPQIIDNGVVKDTVKNMPELAKLGTDYLKELLTEKMEQSDE